MDTLAQYRQAAVTHEEAAAEGDSRRANRAYDELESLAVALEPEQLLRLLDDENVFVRKAAAVDVLQIASDEAVRVLGAIAEGPERLQQLSAEILLQQWAAGER